VISVAAMVILITTATQIGGRFGSASLEIAYFVSTLFLAVALLVGASMAVGKSTTYR